MCDISDRLAKIKTRLSDEAFLGNKGLSNEVGVHIFCYAPQNEAMVCNFFNHLKAEIATPFHLIEQNLYQIFLSICEDKCILDKIPAMEQKKGKVIPQTQLQRVASPEVFVEKMVYTPLKNGDVLLLTGIGAVFPFMRAHKILDNMQHIFSDIPILMLYPGEFDGQNLHLFGAFPDGNYYRAFNLI